MKISELKLKNFKRFTDLTLCSIPETSKLILLIGANGSGKSSIFDAFNVLVKNKPKSTSPDEYFIKKGTENFEISLIFTNGDKIVKTDLNSSSTLPSNSFYGRPSLRIVPRVDNNTPFDESIMSNNIDRPEHFIEADTKFNLDILKYTQEINKALREPVFAGIQADTLQIFKDHVEPINNALARIFNLEDSISLKLFNLKKAHQVKLQL